MNLYLLYLQYAEDDEYEPTEILCGVFDSEEKAEQARDELEGATLEDDDYLSSETCFDIEEVELNAVLVEKLPEHLGVLPDDDFDEDD